MIVFRRLLLRLAASGIHVQHAFQKLLNIPPEDFRWYAAFHDEGGHPHVHMMAWSKKPGQAYLNRDGIRKIKSVLTNQIFQQELLHIYEDKSQSSDELVRETRSAMAACRWTVPAICWASAGRALIAAISARRYAL